MEFLWALLTIALVSLIITVFYCVGLKEIIIQLNLQLVQSKKQIDSLNNEYIHYRVNYVVAESKVVTKVVMADNVLDAQTKKLLSLAMNNSNPNEARNAAMLVCKRLAQRN